MENDLQEELRAIYAKFLAEMKDIMEDGDDSDIAWLTPKAEDKFIASLTSLIDREKVKELQAADGHCGFEKGNSTYLNDRIKTLTPGGSDNDQ